MRTWLRARRREATVLWHRLQPGPHALILAYHRVIDLPCDPYHLCTQPTLFQQHVSLLRGRVIPLADLAAGAPGISLTFDDGYFDNLETVAPLLRQHRMPATFFVTAHPRDREFWWNELEQRCLRTPTQWKLYTDPPRTAQERELKRRYLAREGGEALPVRPTHRLLTDDELRQLGDFEIGAHTLNHERLPLLSETDQRAEIDGSRRHLEDVLQRPVTSFAYPYGAYDGTSRQVTEESGFTHACTIAPGLVRPYTDRFLLPRVHADGMPLAVLERLLRLGNLR